MNNTTKDQQITALYLEHGDQVFKSVRRAVHGVDDEVINDACAFAWMTAFRAPGFDPNADHAIGYITLTATREGYRLSNLESRETSIEMLHDAGYDPSAPSTDHDSRVDAMDLLDQLGENQRKAVYAVHVLGLSYKQAADALGWSHTQINRHVTEGMARIRKLRG